MSALGQQAGSVETAVRLVSGAAAVKPSAKERDYLVQILKDASATLRWLEMHEEIVRKAIREAA